MQKVELFATPESMDAMMEWLKQARDPYVTTGAMMMYNLMVEVMQERKESVG